MSYASQIFAIAALALFILSCVLIGARRDGACKEALVGAWISGLLSVALVFFAAGFSTPMTARERAVDNALHACRMDVTCNRNEAIKTLAEGGAFR